MTFKTTSSITVYQGRVFDVRQDQILLPNGNNITLDIVVHEGSVALLPLDEQGNILFVRQYRYAAGVDMLELPAGVMDKNETPEACAFREVREETGMAAEHLVRLGEFYLAPGYSTEYMYTFLATGLRPDQLQCDMDEFLEVEKIPLQRAYEMAEKGEIQDGKTLATLLLAKPHLMPITR